MTWEALYIVTALLFAIACLPARGILFVASTISCLVEYSDASIEYSEIPGSDCLISTARLLAAIWFDIDARSKAAGEGPLDNAQTSSMEMRIRLIDWEGAG